jgi:hypothetical protein
MLLLHGDVPHHQAEALAQCILDKGPYKMIGTRTTGWVLDSLETGDWLSFETLPAGAVLWDDLHTLLVRMGLGYAVVLQQDFHGNGDEDVSVLCARDPKMGNARFLYGSSLPSADGKGGLIRRNGRLLLSVDAITPETLAHAQVWQAWLDTMRTRVARTAHATLDMLSAQN